MCSSTLMCYQYHELLHSVIMSENLNVCVCSTQLLGSVFIQPRVDLNCIFRSEVEHQCVVDLRITAHSGPDSDSDSCNDHIAKLVESVVSQIPTLTFIIFIHADNASQ